MDIEVFAEKTEDQINCQLRAKCDEHQCTKECVGDAVLLFEGCKKQRWQGKYRSLRHCGIKASVFCAFIVGRVHFGIILWGF